MLYLTDILDTKIALAILDRKDIGYHAVHTKSFQPLRFSTTFILKPHIMPKHKRRVVENTVSSILHAW